MPAKSRPRSATPKAAMVVRFWGVRGSLPAPGAGTLKTGGNTACVEVRCGGETVIFDLGTGLRPLGLSLARNGPVRASLFLSHYHWDHIAGLPFFAPAYDSKSELVIHGAMRRGRDVRQILSGQMVDPYFPVDLGVLNAHLRFVTLQDGGFAHLGGAVVRAAELNHPGGALGFRLEHQGRVMVYATDFEHGTAADDRLVELARGADLLIFDAQYTPAEYAGGRGVESKKGWGHSTYAVGAQMARRAGAKKLALYHHAPDRDDRGIAKLAAAARKLHPGAFAAREGLEVAL
jgi:phosphoribosyl 1,2-cyclic phosphodiesterase